MVPVSDELEEFHGCLQRLDGVLAKYKGAEVKQDRLITSIGDAAKRWVRLSQALRVVSSIDVTSLEQFDINMRDVLQMTNTRARSSAYQKKLRPLLDGFVDKVVIPLIRHEGSPAQVAGRQIRLLFDAPLTAEEVVYIDEAVSCVTVRCYRAAIVMLWAAAIARFHQLAQTIGFTAFTAALTSASAKKGNPYSRVSKSTTVLNLPDLQRLRDFDVLVTGMELGKYDLQVFEELDRLLGVRNGAAHPGMLQPTALDVQQFASKLNTLVFARVH